MTQWICRYVSIYLWLPVADLFSAILAKIQILIVQNDIERLATDPSFSVDASNGVYIIFMLIGIIGYFTIPSVSNWIIQAGGMGNYGRNVNATTSKGGSFVAGAAGAALGNIRGRLLKS
jgi:conjugative transposon TraJ protein